MRTASFCSMTLCISPNPPSLPEPGLPFTLEQAMEGSGRGDEQTGVC